MVEFLTVFLGLITGAHAVELNAVGPVAEIEVLLDGETLTTLISPPWTFECDFGEGLLPHDLVAVARDADGRELDRAVQWINVAPFRSAAKLAVTSNSEGRPESLEVRWESIGSRHLSDVTVTFDGQPLVVEDAREIPLPEHDADEFHFLSAEVRFPNDVTNRLETDFGGLRAEEVSTELTAVAVRLTGGGLPPVRKMASWLVSYGEPLAVHGVEKGGAELLVVRGPSVQETLDDLAAFVFRSGYDTDRGPPALWTDWDPEEFFASDAGAVAGRMFRHSAALRVLDAFAPLDGDVRLRFVSPNAGLLRPPGVAPESFPRSHPHRARDGGLGWLFQQQPPMSFAPQVADAVALAGLVAHGGNGRRAVLLILGADGTDHSEYSPAIARGYLRALGVPLYVWTFGGEAHPGWGEVTDLGDPAEPRRASRHLTEALERILKDLKKQRMIWLEGRHLPHRVELGPAARGIELAGS